MSHYDKFLDDNNYAPEDFKAIPRYPDILVSPPLSDSIQYRYNEDKFIKEFSDYIASTYKQHYVVDENDIQAIDAWFTLGNADTTCRDTILKYAWRLGKKDAVKKEVQKIMHYCLFILHDCERKGIK